MFGGSLLGRQASQVVLVVKNPHANAGNTEDLRLIPGLERSPAGGHGNPSQNSGLENPFFPGEAWWATKGCKESDMTEAT